MHEYNYQAYRIYQRIADHWETSGINGRKTHINISEIEAAMRICRIKASLREEITAEVQTMTRHIIKMLHEKEAEEK